MFWVHRISVECLRALRKQLTLEWRSDLNMEVMYWSAKLFPRVAGVYARIFDMRGVVVVDFGGSQSLTPGSVGSRSLKQIPEEVE
jgi:hypothetical protein